MTAPTPDSLFADYLKGGDAERFAALHDLLREELLRAAERLAPDRSAAEDLVQATFLGALESASRFERGRKVVPWLYGILQNQARSMRWRQRRTPDSQRLHWPEPPDPADQAADREFDAQVGRAFAQLGPVYEPVMQLALREGLSAQEISRALGRPAGTVRTQVVRGTAMLRSLLPAGVASLLLVRVTPGLEAGGVRQLLLDHAARGRVPRSSWWRLRGLQVTTAGVCAVMMAWFATTIATDDGVPPVVPSAEVATGTARDPQTVASTGIAGSDGVGRSLAGSPVATGLTVLVTHAGAPVARLPVHLESLVDRRFQRHLRLTDAAGRAQFENLPEGTVLVTPAKLHGPRHEALLELAPGVAREHRIELEQVIACAGRVVDERGAPVANAEVWLCDGDYQFTYGMGAQRALATDTEGRFDLMTTLRQRFTHLQVVAPGYLASAVRALPREPGEPMEIVLVAGGAVVEGRVIDRAGLPLPGVLVRARLAGARSDLAVVGADGTLVNTDTRGMLREVRTEVDGRFAIGGFAREAVVEIKVWEAAYARLDAVVTAGEPAITVTLEPGVTLHGRVVDAAGKPVANARVGTELDGDDPVVCMTTTQRDGNYVLTGVTPGDAVMVQARSLPDPVDGSGGAGNASAQLRLLPGKRVAWNPILTPGTTFRGTLRREDGTVLQGWECGLNAIDPVGDRSWFQFRCAADGSFAVNNLPASRYLLQLRDKDAMALQFLVTWPLLDRYDIVVPAKAERRAQQALRSQHATVAPGAGRVAIEGVSHADMVSFYLFAIDDAGEWCWVGSGVKWDAARSRYEANLLPGRYELVVFSIQWSTAALATADQAMAFSIVEGQTTVLRPVLQPGVRRSFRIVEPLPQLGAYSAFAEVRNEAGGLVNRWIVPRWLQPAPGTFEASVALAPGRYRLEVETDLGHRGGVDFTVDGLQPFPEVLPLRVR